MTIWLPQGTDPQTIWLPQGTDPQTIWLPQGTDRQREFVVAALARCLFPFDVMLPRLQAQTGRDHIPVDRQDLSRYGAALAAQRDAGGHGHVHEGGDTADPIEARARVLGLAWYSGRVTLDVSLEADPELAAEVLLSEGAHMIDFFWMRAEHRAAVWNAVHPNPAEHVDPATPITDGVDLGHGHGWFDVADYRSWVGEAWMGLFTRAYSDVAVTIPFAHPATDSAVAAVRSALTPFFTSRGGRVYHDSHAGVTPAGYHVIPPVRARPCRTCKPTAWPP